MIGKSYKTWLIAWVIFLIIFNSMPLITSIAQYEPPNLTIDAAVTYQTMDGIGSNINVWSWKNGELRPALDLLIDTLGHNMFRVVRDPINWAGTGSERPAAVLTGLRNLDHGTLMAVYEAPAMQDIWEVIGYLNSKGIGEDQIILNFMGWTAPWMGGNEITNDAQTNQDMATMLASLVYYGHHRRDISGGHQNLAFRYLSPFNEPDYVGGPEGPTMDPAQMNTIFEDTLTTLSDMGDTTTILIGPDTASSPEPYINAYSQAVLARMNHFSWHSYFGGALSPTISRGGILNDWITERSVWCGPCNLNQPLTETEWDYGASIGDAFLGDIGNGLSALLTWEGFDTFYYHDNTYMTWGHLACTQNGGGCTTADTDPRVYTIRGRAWAEATIAKAVRPGMVRRGLTTTLTDLKAVAFYDAISGQFSIIGHNRSASEITLNGELIHLPAVNTLSLYLTNASNNLQRMNDLAVNGNRFTVTIPPDTFFSLIPVDTPTSTLTTTATPIESSTAITTYTPTQTTAATITPTRTAPATNSPTQTATASNTPIPPEAINPLNIAALPAGTNVLLNFDNFSNPSDGQAIPTGYAGCTWNTFVEGSPWAGINTWNFYIANGGPQGTINFPRPVIINSIRVSSAEYNQFTLSGAGNPNASITTTGNSPQTLITGWTTPITTLTLRSSTNDQVFDDLRLTIANSSISPTPSSTITPTFTPTSSRTSAPIITNTPTPIVTSTATRSTTATSTPTRTITSSPTSTQLSDLIFADSFESSNYSAWSSSITNSGALRVSTTAALVQTYGMQAAINNNTSMYVADNSPVNAARYRARFYFNPNSISMGSRDAHYLLYGLTSSGTVVVRVEFGQSSTSYRIRAGLINNNKTFMNSTWINISNAAHFIEFDWQAAASPDEANGSLILWIDGVQRASVTGISNDTRLIESVRFGPVDGIDNRTRGTEYFDAFQSNRSTYIGP